MNFKFLYLLYSLFGICYFIWIVLKSKRKIPTSLVAFWILSYPILNRNEFLLHTPWGFDLQPTRIFLLVGIFLLIFEVVKFLLNKGIENKWKKVKVFEIFLISYVIFSSVVIINKAPRIQEIIPLVSGQIVFLVMYFLSKGLIDSKDRAILNKLIIVFGILSVMVSITQFFAYPNFFRISAERAAFGSYTRANGFMVNEYDNGLFLTSLTAVILFQRRSVCQKMLFSSFFGIGVLLTMHRGSWLIYCIAILIYLIVQISETPKKIIKLIVLPFYVFLNLGLLFFLIYPNTTNQKIISQDFLRNQLFRDTIGIRVDLANLGLNIIQQHPEGLGDYSFSSYGQMYFENGFKLNYGTPLIVHNGFVGSAVKFGVFGGSLFLLFCLSVLLSSLKIGNRDPIIYYPITTIIITFIVINLTQEFSGLGGFPQIVISFIFGNLGRNYA